MLVLRNISKSYAQRGLVLDDLSFDMKEGDSIAIMGPSGSGKTTLLNIIGLLDKPDHGQITFRGSLTGSFTDNEAATYRNQNIGFVFQDHLLLPHLTVYENILLPLYAAKQTKKDMLIKEEFAEQLMYKTGISGLASKYPSNISGGEAQRTALVRALINNPSLLLADEPTGSLDARNAETLSDLLGEMNREFGIAMILATHSEKLAGKMSRTMLLTDGKLNVST